jgi:peptidoglycan/xylan/chitin deacetylase (PgdA/CDA1 family)
MSIKQRIKLGVYTAAKLTGMFKVSRFLMRRRLMILGYHGLQYSDEACFRQILFMDRRRFTQRLDLIMRGKYPVLTLSEGILRLKNGTLPANAVVITIDDGFYSTLDLTAPLLHEHGFPATLYVTSYNVTKGTPVFILVIQYLFWKTECTSFELPDHPWFPANVVDLRNDHATHQAIQQIIDYGEAHCDEPRRQEICAAVATALNLDFETICKSRGLSLLTPDELRQLDAFGIDVQLHTHRHTFPANNPEQARRELQDNRDMLEKIPGHRLEHFCYPGGNWTPDLFPILIGEGIVSATTCEAGMNHQTTNLLALYRILDQNNLDDIEFEAELTGFCELLRIIRGRCRRNDSKHSINS